MRDLRPIKCALVSVSDKTGLVDFSHALTGYGIELFSTGGSAQMLHDHGCNVREVSELTGLSEMMDGRVKTLHHAIHGGLLAHRDNPAHVASMEQHGICGIDLLVVNLYPFEKTVASGESQAHCIENIDVGGPAMIRAAAKNHACVAVVVDPEDYDSLLAELEDNDGATRLRFRQQLAERAFARTSAYDSDIAHWMCSEFAVQSPRRMTVSGRLDRRLRYGENPHQSAALYARHVNPIGIGAAKQHQGKDLSYNNLMDVDAALDCVREFASERGPACVIVKHANPCGVAQGATVRDAYCRALACDTTSAFGGILAFNQPLDEETALEISKIFTEVVAAPEVTEGALNVLETQKNLRVLTNRNFFDSPAQSADLMLRPIVGGFLVQDRDVAQASPDQLRVVSKRPPTSAEMTDMQFAWHVVKHVKSNAIVFAKDCATVGIGAGQTSRVDSVIIAMQKADALAETLDSSDSPLRGSSVASDAFFPFPDALLKIKEAGATAVIQPGGSVRDPEVIAAADAGDMAMVFTGMRHFRH